MPNIKLYYPEFPFWRAEVARLALHLGNVPFENVKVAIRSPEDKAAFKASGKSPFGQAPTLEVDGKIIAQTGAIARYCGKQGGFYPKDDVEAAMVDMIIDTATDITMAIGKTFGMKDEEKAAARAHLSTETLPMYFGALEKIMTENGSTGYYVGNSMTIADLAMWRLLGWVVGGALDGVPKEVLDPFTQMKANFENTGNHEKIKAYMAEKYPNFGK